jgi:hypothetical protein
LTARLITVTLGSGATQISATPAYFNQMIVQNDSAAVANLGDSTVTASTGVALAASGAANSIVAIGPFSGQQGDASQFWLYGTGSDKVTVLLV